MFTGIVEEVGAVNALRPGRLVVDCAAVLEGTRVGDSVSVNGVCLTVTEIRPAAGFAADLMGETLARTALGELDAGAPVNLERAVQAGGRLDGHLVQGHVDGVVEVTAVTDEGQWTTMEFTLPAALAPYVVEKGSVAVDGTSLTVAQADPGTFRVGLIPHTMAVTVLGRRRVGDRVNVEVDVIAKYVERMIRGGVPSPYTPQES